MVHTCLCAPMHRHNWCRLLVVDFVTPLKKRRFTRESLVESPYMLTSTTSSLVSMSTPPHIVSSPRSMPTAIDVTMSSPSHVMSPPPSHFMSSPLTHHRTMAKSMVEVAAREEVDAAHMLLSLTGSGSIDKILGRSQLNGIALPSQPTAQQASSKSS